MTCESNRLLISPLLEQVSAQSGYGTCSTRTAVNKESINSLGAAIGSEGPPPFSRGDSGICTPSLTPISSTTPPLSSEKSCNFYSYMENRTSDVEQELRNILLTEDGDEGLDVHAAILSINNEEGYENITIQTEYESVEEETKRYKSAFGILCRLKNTVVELQNQLGAYCDQFVGIGPDNDAILARKKSRNFDNRLDACLVDVDEKLHTIRQKNEVVLNGVRQGKRKNWVALGKFPVDCVAWLHGLLFLFLCGIITYMYLWSDASGKWTVYLRLVRSPIIVVLLLYLYGINMKVWVWCKIDYITIFGHSSTTGSHPTPNFIFNIAGILTFLFTALVLGLVLASPYSFKLPIKIVPLVMWFILLGFLINPINIFLKKVRFNFIVVFVHILVAPFVFVYFSDFFLADQFNSTVGILLDFQYFFCYSVTDLWSSRANPLDCTSSGNGIRPILSLLPALWRMLQCIRCYYDTRNLKHLVNAMKYFTTFPVVVFASFFAANVRGNIGDQFKEFSWIIICWAISGFIHALYTFLWDVCCDWGLWNITECTFFKRKLVYKYKSLYWMAIIVDLLLRFSWTLKLTLAIVWAVDSDLIYTGLVLAEIIRRFIWNFFRVEYAHVLSEKI